MLESFAWYTHFRAEDAYDKWSKSKKKNQWRSFRNGKEEVDLHAWLDFQEANEALDFSYLHNETSMLYVISEFKHQNRDDGLRSSSGSLSSFDSCSDMSDDQFPVLEANLLSKMTVGKYGQYVINPVKSSLLTLLDAIADVDATKPLFYDPEMEQPLLYGEMHNFITGNGNLSLIGVKHEDVVAYVAPPGIVSATVFLTVACQCIASPIDPSYSAEDFLLCIDQLNPRVLIIFEECSCRDILSDLASKQGVTVVNAKSDSRGLFQLLTTQTVNCKTSQRLIRKYNEVALILRTSGSTSKPKLCPITMDALVSNAISISKNLRLTPNDVALNAMPLFHIGGISSNVLSSIVSGASVILMKEFDAKVFFSLLSQDQLDTIPKPTWYSAVPTLHSSICDVAANDPITTANINLRFIRSGAAALPKDLWERLEVTFQCPVISTYSMTEQVSSINFYRYIHYIDMVNRFSICPSPSDAYHSSTGSTTMYT